MRPNKISRRSVLALTASCAVAGVGVAQSADSDGDDENGDAHSLTRESFELLEGTDREATVHVTQADDDGPTVVVVGGLHGNEVAGYVAANEITEWEIDTGMLVTIPEANAVAIDRGTRTDDEGVDLNRQFVEGKAPRTELADAIWTVIRESDADIVIDLHESTGIYAGDPVDGVGQAIFHSGNDAAATAEEAVQYVNETSVDDPDLEFETGAFTGPTNEPTGLLVHKASRDHDADTFLVETLSTDVDLETRVGWHSTIVERLLVDEVFIEGEPENGVDEPDEDEREADEEDVEPDEDEDEDEVDEPDREPPRANIQTTPDGADETELEPQQAIELDASNSCAPDGEITCYEWSVENDGHFEETGEVIEVTIAANGEHPVVLRVVDDAGATDTAEITLSTA